MAQNIWFFDDVAMNSDRITQYHIKSTSKTNSIFNEFSFQVLQGNTFGLWHDEMSK